MGSRYSTLGQLAFALGGLAAAVDCSSFDSAGAPADDAGADVVPAGQDAGNEAGDSAAAPFAAALVAVPGLDGAAPFHIEATEVTQAAYAAFLATAPSVATQQSACGFNADFAPDTKCGTFDPTNHPTLPVTCVDWCDAAAYCKAVGRRLCGKRGGFPIGPFDTSQSSADSGSVRSVNVAELDEWMAACSANGDGAHAYSSGSTLKGCVRTATTRAEVATSDCIGGFPGIFDLSGNVAEWENACDGAGATSADNACRARGGSYASTDDVEPRCGYSGQYDTASLPRGSPHPHIGFRCCAD